MYTHMDESGEGGISLSITEAFSRGEKSRSGVHNLILNL